MRLYLIVLVLLGGIIAVPAPVGATPAAPAFGSSIDDYAEYDGQDTCDPTPKPGVLGLRDLLHQSYGPHTWGIVRSCAVAGISEHEEGRALDYHFDYYDAAQRAAAADLLGWLLATDRYGNQHAMARRLGLMYIIWNRQIWESYRPLDGWQPYGGYNPHTDHIHFSFSWAGALAQTSWWTGGQVASAGAQLADFDGDGRPDLATFGATLSIARNVSTPGVPAKEPAQQIPGDWGAVRDPAVADWNGDGMADILGTHQDSLKVWLSTGGFSFAPGTSLAAAGVYLNPADFDGDGKLELIPLGPAFAQASQLTAIDWDGDRKADVFGRQGESMVVWPGTGNGFGMPVVVGTTALTRMLTPADFDGDGKPDLGILSADAANLYFFRNTSAPGMPSLASGEPVIGGWRTQSQLLSADFDSDGRADVVGRRGGMLQVWLSDSTTIAWSFRSYVALTRQRETSADPLAIPDL